MWIQIHKILTKHLCIRYCKTMHSCAGFSYSFRYFLQKSSLIAQKMHIFNDKEVTGCFFRKNVKMFESLYLGFIDSYRVYFNDCLFSFTYQIVIILHFWYKIGGKIFICVGDLMNSDLK